MEWYGDRVAEGMLIGYAKGKALRIDIRFLGIEKGTGRNNGIEWEE